MDKTKDFIGFLDKMQGLLDNAHQKGHIIVRIEDIENTFPELKRDKEREFNGAIVEEDFNEGDGFYKMSLAYLSTEQVEEIEGLVGSWNHNEKQCQVKESTEIQHDNKTCKENDDSLTSDDKIIRKDLIEYFKGILKYCGEKRAEMHKAWIAWLEKQAKYKSPEEVLKIRQELYQSGYNDGYKHGCEDTKKKGANPQGKSALEAIHEQKVDNANKVEAKQKSDIEKGKWYVCNTPRYTDFVVGKAYCCPKNGMLKPNENEIARYVARDCFHLWSIEDAKDGDVLSYENEVFIVKKSVNLNILYYCCYDGEHFIIDSFYSLTIDDINNIRPATKEQRNLLFQKMKEAGYEWDDKEKKPIKSEVSLPSFDEQQGTPVITTDTYCKENCKGYHETGKCYADGSCDAKIKAEQNLVWSKEDERNLQGIIDEIEANKNNAPDYDLATYDRFLSWLKSLKERATWKPSKEQIKALNEAVGIVGLFTPRGSYLKSLSEQLKRL